MMEFDAFISSSSRDKTAADATCAVLESAGVRCWIAPRDVRPGVEYGAAIIDAIERCHVMVLIFSSSANESRQVHREIERAVSRGIPIVPVRIEDVVPTKSMEYFLGAIHWLDALTPPWKAICTSLPRRSKQSSRSMMLHKDGPTMLHRSTRAEPRRARKQPISVIAIKSRRMPAQRRNRGEQAGC